MINDEGAKTAHFALRPYQSTGFDQIRDAFGRGARAPLYVLPTGGGKTAVFSRIAEGAKAKGNRVFILVHRQELLDQASGALHRLGVNHGIIHGDKTMVPGHPVQVASVPSLVKRLDRFTPPDLIIIDEAHHAPTKSKKSVGNYRKIINAYPSAKLLGVTATPIRSDGTGLDEIFDHLIMGPTIGELISLGYLVQPKVFAPPVGIDLAGIPKRGGDFDRTQANERIDRAKITGDCVDHYLRLSRGEPGICFCVSIRHAEHVAESFRARGVRAERVDGGMDDRDRRNAIAALGSGSLDLLTSADLIGEGVDLPRVSVAILLRPTYSEALYLQQVGRALRPFEGKTRALILDHVGNVMRHGLPDDVREWSLKGDRGGTHKPDDDEGVQIKQCERCFAVYERGPKECPECGLIAPDKPRSIETKDGELKELTREQMEAARAKRDARIAQGKAKSLDDLLKIEKQMGYKPGWARHVFSNRRH
jgi:DNA repair protein RadD